MANFDYSTREITGLDGQPIWAAEISGSVDPATIEFFQHMFNEFLTSDKLRLALFLENLKYINSTGMGMMVQYADTFNGKGGKIILANVPAKVQLVMEMLGLQELFTSVNNESEVPAAFAGKDVAEPITFENQPSETDLPLSITCGSCNASLNIAGKGKYICPRCGSLLAVDAGGSVITHPDQSESAVEAILPANEAFLSGLSGLVKPAAAKAGIEGAAAEAFAGAVEDCGRYLCANALGNNPSERLHFFISADGHTLRAKVYAAGAALNLQENALRQVPELSAATGAAKISFATPQGGNLFTIEKTAN